jgi:putative glutamine amidotransferase
MAMMNAAPWIGMPAQMDPGSDKQYLNRQYSDAVAAAGGLPIAIPLLEATGLIHSLTERLDGILLTGSNSDLNPELYGAARLDVCEPAQPLRDQMDFFLLETALRRKIPVLAICYGVQSLNVFLGGSLIQDISTAINTHVRHRAPESNGGPCHEIKISSGSILEQIVGLGEIRVNSTHHQAIDRPGHGLKAIARAFDGVIESVVHTDPGQWVLGVQWHPEKSFDHDIFSRKLFENFLARCRAVRGIDEGTDT